MDKLPKNIEQAKELVNRYRAVTEEEILSLMDNIHDSGSCVEDLSGFGSQASCTLCLTVGAAHPGDINCNDCIYQGDTKCFRGPNNPTYVAILESETADELIKAFRDRANHIESIIAKLYEKPTEAE